MSRSPISSAYAIRIGFNATAPGPSATGEWGNFWDWDPSVPEMIQLSQLKLIFECCCLSLPVVHDTLASFDMTEQCLLYSCLSFGYAKGAGVCSHVTETNPDWIALPFIFDHHFYGDATLAEERRGES